MWCLHVDFKRPRQVTGNSIKMPPCTASFERVLLCFASLSPQVRRKNAALERLSCRLVGLIVHLLEVQYSCEGKHYLTSWTLLPLPLVHTYIDAYVQPWHQNRKGQRNLTTKTNKQQHHHHHHGHGHHTTFYQHCPYQS